MTNIELQQFTGKCIALGYDESIDHDVISAIQQGKVDWERFVLLASNHLILPTIYLRFKKNNLLDSLPQELTDHLKMVYELNCQRNKTILEQIDKINRLFTSKGIFPIYMKGTGNLMDNLYEDIGERMIGDIDFLVSDYDYLTVANLLIEIGYEPTRPFYDSERYQLKHYPRLVHPVDLADVEVHRLPSDIKYEEYFNYAMIDPLKKKIESDLPTFVLSDEHKAILNFYHGFLSHDVSIMGDITFRSMLDLFLISRRIDVGNVFSNMPKYSKDAIIYSDVIFYTLGIKQQGFSAGSRRYIKRLKKYRESGSLYHSVWTVKYLAARFYKGYLYTPFRSIYDKPTRRSVFRRLSDPHWYKSHIKSYTESFKVNFRKSPRE